MYNGLKYTLIFSLGAAVGVAASWKILETKYKQIADEEIASVKEMYAKKAKSSEEVEPNEDNRPIFPSDDDKKQMKSLINDYVGEGGSETMEFSSPYVIAPEEFGELEDYDRESLTYYADGVLTDDQDSIIEDVDNLIGKDSLTHFGEYEDDSVFVRNDRFRCDYEILMDIRDYSDAKETFLTPSDEE